MPATVAICAVFVTGGSARAQDDTERSQLRQVALVDLSDDDDVSQLDKDIYKALNDSDVLRNPSKREFDRYLTGKLDDEDAQQIATARKDLADAETQLGNPDPKDAEKLAREGQKALSSVVPTGDVQALYADLTLVLGLALLDLHRGQDANRALALVHRLDPARQLDPVKYPPDIITAFKHASETVPAKLTLEIKANGRVWIDLVERGPAPGTFADLEAGDHLITITGPLRSTSGEPVRLEQSTAITIPDSPIPEEVRVGRVRLELSRAQAAHDDVGRAGAMHKLAALLGVGDVVMISKRPDRKLQWETWKDRAPGFSAPKEVTAAQRQHPEQLLEGIAPAKKIEPPKPNMSTAGGTPIKPIGQIDIEKPWYELRWVQASMIGTAAAIIVGGILYARRDKMLGIDTDIKQGM